MSLAADPRRFFSERRDFYARFIRVVRYPQGLRAFWRGSRLLAPGLRILEAGCGTGALTFAVWDALAERGFPPAAFHAFDLTPAMLATLRERLQRRRMHTSELADRDAIELAEADVLRLETLPASWRDYDVLVSASMLEYVPRDRLVAALASLRARLRPGGTFVLFITRRNVLTKLLVGRLWASNLYTAAEVRAALAGAGFTAITFRGFPWSAMHLTPWGHVVEARA